MEGNGSWFSHLRDYMPFVLATGTAQPRLQFARIVEALIISGVVSIATAVAGIYIALPSLKTEMEAQANLINAKIAAEARLTRIELDNLQRQMTESKRAYEEGQRSDKDERRELENRIMRRGVK